MGLGQAPGAPDPAVTVPYDSVYLTLAVMVGVLLMVALLLIFITVNLVNLVRVREGKEAYTFGGTLAMTKHYALNPYVASIGTLVVAVIGLTIITPIMRNVGHSQGYMPEQPIWFSHKIHAGQFEIDCQYCHSGASKGKNAWIPAVSVCMNCHKGIQEGTQTGTKEIAKIYAAYDNNVPIEWVRVHSLPDLAYFNHQQHVVAGKVECQECHGPIQEMDVVYQYNRLSMGWCINCHRTKEVQADLYKALGREDVHTVADQGGLECARCHY
ncbi:MAG: cytochrome c3 family protein [Bacteroidia bacterium]